MSLLSYSHDRVAAAKSVLREFQGEPDTTRRAIRRELGALLVADAVVGLRHPGDGRRATSGLARGFIGGMGIASLTQLVAQNGSVATLLLLALAWTLLYSGHPLLAGAWLYIRAGHPEADGTAAPTVALAQKRFVHHVFRIAREPRRSGHLLPGQVPPVPTSHQHLKRTA